MPLDISDEDLLLPQHELAQVVARLDANGWNAAGKFSPATYGRLVYQMTVIRDEILEIFLGSSTAGLAEITYGPSS